MLERLAEDPGYIALLSGKELELLAEMDPDDVISSQSSATSSPTKSKLGATSYKEAASSGSGSSSSRYSRSFLSTIQKAADRHLQEKNESRDALSLLKIYHRASSAPAAGAAVARGTAVARGAGVDRATGRDDTDASSQKKSKKLTKKSATKAEQKFYKSDAVDGSGGVQTRQSLAVAKSKPGSAEASPNKRRKNSDLSK